MRFEHLDDWLQWQQTLNPSTIDLGLDRVRQVFHRLGLDRIANRVITVAGTNGKGSTVAAYETWLANAAYRVGSYTSPHLLSYNERIRLDLQAVSDEWLCQAFDVVDQAREDIALTYFEFGTLAAMVLINRQQPDFAILEVGLGGRLDAVNIIDPDLAHITNIGLDHQDWLGETREEIGYEKAGILRESGLAVCNDSAPPASLTRQLQDLRCQAAISGRDYSYQWVDEQHIHWRDSRHALRVPVVLAGNHQAHNLSGVLAGLSLLGCLDKPGNPGEAGFDGLLCPGRLQAMKSSLPMSVVLDVGHNVDAARVLDVYLRSLNREGRLIVLLGMLKDKDPAAFISVLGGQVDEWWFVDLPGERGLTASQLSGYCTSSRQRKHLFDGVETALAHAMSCLGNQDILLVTGSFLTVEAAMKTSYLKN